MDRVVTVNHEDLEWACRLSPEDRLRQANAAFRLYHALHRPFEKPSWRSFRTYEEFIAADEEDRLRH